MCLHFYVVAGTSIQVEKPRRHDYSSEKISFYSRTIGKCYSNSGSVNTFKIPLLFQCLRHSIISSVLGSNCPLSQETVRRAPENTRSGSALIAGIERISRAI